MYHSTVKPLLLVKFWMIIAICSCLKILRHYCILQGIAAGAQNSNGQLSIQPTDLANDTKKDHSHELVCADTSGIGSTQTSPRHSSRPSSSQSRNDSVTVQPLEDQDQDLDLVEVKKEQDENSGNVSVNKIMRSIMSLKNGKVSPEGHCLAS